MKKFLIEKCCEGLRVDQAVAVLCENMSRTQAQILIEHGFVLYEGQPVKKRQLVQEGAFLEVSIPPLLPTTLLPQKMDFSILYEDASLFVINKPAHLVVHPAHGSWEGTFAHGFLAHCQEIAMLDPLRPGIVHRLDKDTSGVLIAAKTAEASADLSRQFHDRQVYKRYQAILVGEMRQDMIVDRPIGRDPKDRKKMACVSGGKEARSLFKVKNVDKGLTFVEIQIETGRTHQIRVHAKSIGFPVLGDIVYGNASMNARFSTARQLLHCAEIRLCHPITRVLLVFQAPPPYDMDCMIQKSFS